MSEHLFNGKTIEGAAVIFDLDGTLIDSARDLAKAMNHVLGLAGRPEVPVAQVRHMVGRGALALIHRGLAATGGLLEEPEIKRLHAAFLAYYADHVADETVLFDGAREMLEGLRADGARIGLCTNKPIGLTLPLLDALGIRDAFDAVHGGDSFAFRKPDPRHILETATAVGGAHPRIVMVGDSASDIDAAIAARIPSIAVDFGYTETPPTELGASIVIDHLSKVRIVAATLL